MSDAVENERVWLQFSYFKHSTARLLLPHVKRENVSSAYKMAFSNVHYLGCRITQLK
jgi:hypothetical protein